MATTQLNLTQQQKDALTKAGIDWSKILQAIQTYGPMVLQLILALLGKTPPTPTPTKQGTHGSSLKSMSDACPCPDGGDGMACCHAAQTHILLAALCCEGHCCQGDQCDTKCCCQETMHHLLKAIECCSCHCCQ